MITRQDLLTAPILDSQAQYDADGAFFIRHKQAPSAWTYQMRGFEITTSKINSIINLDTNNQSLSDAVESFYDAAGAAITDGLQLTLTTKCVRTIVDFEPPYDYYLISGQFRVVVQAANPVYFSLIAAPDVAPPAGSKVMVQNLNIKYVSSLGGIEADGRASKLFQYSASLHTNKLRMIINHNVGDQNTIAVLIEHYKQ